MSRKTKGTRGGSRNKAKDEVDIDHLCDLWLDLHRKNFDVFGSFGEYKGLWAECAARPDLVELIPMARVMCTCSPSLMIGYSDLKEAALMTMNKDISTKPLKEETVQECSRFVADKFVVVQKHFRAISLNKDWKSKLNILMGKLSVNKQNKLQEFVDQLQEHQNRTHRVHQRLLPSPPKGAPGPALPCLLQMKKPHCLFLKYHKMIMACPNSVGWQVKVKLMWKCPICR